MNKERRKAITSIRDKLRDLAADIESIREEENEAFEALPESIQQGDRGNLMEEAMTTLEEAASHASDAADTLDQVSS